MKVIWVFLGYGKLPSQNSSIFEVRRFGERLPDDSDREHIRIRCNFQGLPHQIDLVEIISNDTNNLKVELESILDSFQKQIERFTNNNECVDHIDETNMLEIVSRNMIVASILNMPRCLEYPVLVYMEGCDSMVLNGLPAIVTTTPYFRNSELFIMITKREYKKYLRLANPFEVIVVEDQILKIMRCSESVTSEKLHFDITDVCFMGLIESKILEFAVKKHEINQEDVC